MFVFWVAVCLAGLKGSIKELLTSPETSISPAPSSKDPEAKQEDEVPVGSLTSDFVLVDDSDMKRPTDDDNDGEEMSSEERNADPIDDGNAESDSKSDLMVNNAHTPHAQRDPNDLDVAHLNKPCDAQDPATLPALHKESNQLQCLSSSDDDCDMKESCISGCKALDELEARDAVPIAPAAAQARVPTEEHNSAEQTPPLEFMVY